MCRTQLALRLLPVVHQIIPVYLYGPTGQRLTTLCLLDTGSNATLVLQPLAEKVGFTGELGEISLGGTNKSEVVRSFPVNSLDISGVGRRHRRYTTHSSLDFPSIACKCLWSADKVSYSHQNEAKVGSILTCSCSFTHHSSVSYQRRRGRRR